MAGKIPIVFLDTVLFTLYVADDFSCFCNCYKIKNDKVGISQDCSTLLFYLPPFVFKIFNNKIQNLVYTEIYFTPCLTVKAVKKQINTIVFVAR